VSVCLDLEVEGYFDMAKSTPAKLEAGETILGKNINTFHFDLSVNFLSYWQNNRSIGEEGLIKYMQTDWSLMGSLMRERLVEISGMGI